MVTQYNEKGKIFTQVVSKLPVKVHIQTAQQLIRGLMHIRPDSRVKDELNEQERFLAITDATVYGLQNEELYRSHFMVINVDQIVWVIPDEDMVR